MKQSINRTEIRCLKCISGNNFVDILYLDIAAAAAELRL